MKRLEKNPDAEDKAKGGLSMNGVKWAWKGGVSRDKRREVTGDVLSPK